MQSRCLAVGFLLATALAAAERPRVPTRLTLREALSIALDRSPALKLAAARERQAQGETQLARSELMPHIGLAASQASMTRNLAAVGLTSDALGGRDVRDRSDR